jgi:hypothetical protein
MSLKSGTTSSKFVRSALAAAKTHPEFAAEQLAELAVLLIAQPVALFAMFASGCRVGREAESGAVDRSTKVLQKSLSKVPATFS